MYNFDNDLISNLAASIDDYKETIENFQITLVDDELECYSIEVTMLKSCYEWITLGQIADDLVAAFKKLKKQSQGSSVDSVEFKGRSVYIQVTNPQQEK